MASHKLAEIAAIPEGEGRCFEVEGKQIAVFKVSGEILALDNTCPHRGGPLADGPISGTTVTCPWHGWAFDCKTGQSTMNPALGVQTYQVSVEGDSVMVEL